MIHTQIKYVGITTTEYLTDVDEVHLHFVYTPDGLFDSIALSEVDGVWVHAYLEE